MKKSVKKLCAVILAASMTAMTGCGGSKPAETTAAPAETTAAASEAASSEAAAESAPAGESVSQDTDIVAATAVDFTTMDPMDTSDTLSGGIQRLMMDGLFGFDDEMKIIPMLATGYEANDDATEFTIKLREGIQFSDGTPWNAEAAKANLDRWGDKTLGLKRTTLLCNVLDKTEVVDEYTVKVTLASSFGAFIPTLAHPACVCVSPKVIEKGNEEAAKAPVGTGQYTFVEWIAGEHTTLALNKDWWGYDADICGGTALVDPDAGFKTITFKPVSENATRVAMVQSGDAQVIWPLPSESVESLKGDANVAVGQGSGIVVRYLTMNNQKAPFNDVRVRQAVNYAINKEAYCAVVRNGFGKPAQSIIGPAVQHFKANDPYPYDPEKAKSLLAEAGYPDGFKTTIMCNTTTANLKQAEFYQQQLAIVGIDAEIVSLENAVLNQRVQDVDVPGSEAEVNLYITGWSPSTGDADWGTRPLLAKESEPPMSYNMCYFENDEFDQLLQDALHTADESKRAEAYAKAQDIIWEECPMVCVAVDDNTWATSSKVTDVKIFPDGAINMRNGKLSK
ncbi:MAG: glutathione ABC transporter substrate-binding protein [Lachnospiraceae bacterium]|nr:glutathione ABC transporter substrate-binding protein [Lachnospiraceae bacterium]